MTAKTVLVTGAYSGIGRATSIALAANNFKVFGGTLNQSEANELAGIGVANIKPVVLDISSTASIDEAISSIGKDLGDGTALGGLVNIAGINYNAPLKYLSVEEIQQMVQVNVIGTILLTRGALPLLSRGPGRVVLVGSATAFLPPPTISVYAATKCAISGLGDSLRVELGMAGLSVSVVEPGVVRTPMTALAPKILLRMLDRMSGEDRTRYEKLMRKIVQISVAEKAGVSPEKVATVITDALTVPKPRARYRVGVDSHIAAILQHLPDGARDFIQHKTFGI